jgi:acyl dehydratase
MTPLYFEDFPAGETIEYGAVEVTAEAIVAFARDFDPQPFHLDEEAGREVAGGLIASGWQTTAFLLRMNCEAFLTRAATLGDAGVEEIAWLLPVRPGDILRVRRHTKFAQPLDEAGRGELEFLFEVLNGGDETVMTQRSRMATERRPNKSAD